MKYLQIKKRPCDLFKVMSGSNCFGITLWIFLLITKGAVVRGQTTGGPNEIALINGQTMLDCSTNILAASSWTHTTDGSNNATLIAVGCAAVTGNNAAYYRTQILGVNTCRLIIANATMQQAGVYTCPDGSATTYRSLVTVIEPVANVVVHNQWAEVADGDQLNISCSINYSGPSSPAPSLRPSPYWTTSPGQSYTSTTYHPLTNVVTLVATVTVQKPTVPIFQCNTAFSITGNTVGYNATAPVDSFIVGNTTELDVQYRPSKPSSTTRPEVITISGVPCGISVLTCYSTGNPLPSYRWYDSADNVIISTNSTLTLAEVNRNYKCEAYNKIRDVMYNESTTYNVSKDNCSTSAVNCCVCPHAETTSVTVEGCDNGTLCDCSKGSTGIVLICNATTFPNASYMWTGPDGQVTDGQFYYDVTNNGTHLCTAYFDKASSNYTGDVIFTTGTIETKVDRCLAPILTTTIHSTSSTKTNPGVSTDTPTAVTTNNGIVGMLAGIVIGCILLINILMICVFIYYYTRVGTNERGGNAKMERNKIRLNKRFPWLQKMLPCLNDKKESTGTNCLWVSLFILLGIFTGIITFPILIILAIRSEVTQETSALNYRRENGDANENTANGRRPVNSQLSQSQPGNQTRAVGQHPEDPYQNESRENIELSSSHHSRNLLMTDSPTSSTPPKVRPPPPPTKPTPNTPNTPGRAQNYVVTEPVTMDPNNTTYADLPFMPHVPPTRPVQFLDGTEDAYAELKKT